MRSLLLCYEQDILPWLNLNELPKAIKSLATQLRTGRFPMTKSYHYCFEVIDPH